MTNLNLTENLLSLSHPLSLTLYTNFIYANKVVEFIMKQKTKTERKLRYLCKKKRNRRWTKEGEEGGGGGDTNLI